MLRWLPALGAALLLLVPAPALAGLKPSEASLLREINRVRALHGLPLLRADGRLELAARAQSRQMLHAEALRHGPFAQRLVRFAVRASVTGENLGWGAGASGSAHAIVGAWLASPPHRANLLRASFTRVGVGCAEGAFLGAAGASVVTADFAG
ncbi:MAG TPA: CAP domain-containing protein [Gaiellaceae bacterium]